MGPLNTLTLNQFRLLLIDLKLDLRLALTNMGADL